MLNATAQTQTSSIYQLPLANKTPVGQQVGQQSTYAQHSVKLAENTDSTFRANYSPAPGVDFFHKPVRLAANALSALTFLSQAALGGAQSSINPSASSTVANATVSASVANVNTTSISPTTACDDDLTAGVIIGVGAAVLATVAVTGAVLAGVSYCRRSSQQGDQEMPKKAPESLPNPLKNTGELPAADKAEIV